MKTRSLSLFLLVLITIGSCVKDRNEVTYTISRPEYSVRESVKQAAKVQAPQAMKELGSFVLYGGAMYINEKNKGIHVIDYSDPTQPVNKGFLPIPGNLGLSIKNNFLYADCYCELMVFKILSKDNIQLQGSLPNAFVSRVWNGSYDTNVVAVNWNRKDTTVSAEYYNSHSGYQYDKGGTMVASPQMNTTSGGTSVGSSLAIFTIVNDHLYTVEQSLLNAFSLGDPVNPVRVSSQQAAWNVETIFPFKDKLFIGSMSGMYIFGLTDPSKPSYISQFNHAQVCDPVIADDRFAFVTLRTGSRCTGTTNQLDVVNIENISAPVLVKSFNFRNPHGLSKDGNVLFVCDEYAGLKVLDASDPANLVQKASLPVGKAIDVVATGGKAFVMLDNAIQIYSYDQQFNVALLGNINRN
jgi:hypothetical protein